MYFILSLQKGCEVNRKDKEDNMPLSLCVRYHHDRYMLIVKDVIFYVFEILRNR